MIVLAFCDTVSSINSELVKACSCRETNQAINQEEYEWQLWCIISLNVCRTAGLGVSYLQSILIEINRWYWNSHSPSLIEAEAYEKSSVFEGCLLGGEGYMMMLMMRGTCEKHGGVGPMKGGHGVTLCKAVEYSSLIVRNSNSYSTFLHEVGIAPARRTFRIRKDII